MTQRFIKAVLVNLQYGARGTLSVEISIRRAGLLLLICIARHFVCERLQVVINTSRAPTSPTRPVSVVHGPVDTL